MWLPFAQDIGGGLLVVDLVKGDVFEWQSDGEGRERTHGESFDAFLFAYLARFSRRELRVDERVGVVDAAEAPVSNVAKSSTREATILAIVVAFALVLIVFACWVTVRRL